MKVLVYEHCLVTTIWTDFCGTHKTDKICTKDTEVECIRILKNPYLPDRRDVIIITEAVCDGGEYLLLMPGSYEILN